MPSFRVPMPFPIFAGPNMNALFPDRRTALLITVAALGYFVDI